MFSSTSRTDGTTRCHRSSVSLLGNQLTLSLTNTGENDVTINMAAGESSDHQWHGGHQAATDLTAIAPFSGVVVADPDSGQTETVTVTLSLRRTARCRTWAPVLTTPRPASIPRHRYRRQGHRGVGWPGIHANRRSGRARPDRHHYIRHRGGRVGQRYGGSHRQDSTTTVIATDVANPPTLTAPPRLRSIRAHRVPSPVCPWRRSPTSPARHSPSRLPNQWETLGDRNRRDRLGHDQPDDRRIAGDGEQRSGDAVRYRPHDAFRHHHAQRCRQLRLHSDIAEHRSNGDAGPDFHADHWLGYGHRRCCRRHIIARPPR